MSIVVEHIVSFIVLLRRFIRLGSLLKTLLASGVFFCFLSLSAQNTDTTRKVEKRLLDEVEVSAQRAPTEMRTAAPTQVVDIEKLEHLGALQLSDAVKQMAGVTLKDYGGVGGIKTVSARGLGSQFSAVTIDGIPIDDSQNGQVDLGRYALGNAAYVSFSHGQEESPLLSARAYAAGNTLNLETAEPQFWPGERVKLKAGLEGGSFGFLSPTLQWEQRWSKLLKSSLWVNYLRSDGDYPFTLYYTADRQGQTSRERRQNSAMRMLTADASLFYTIAPKNTIIAKLHYMRGMHQLPGPVVLYNQTPSAQSTREDELFAQARWRTERGRWKWQVLAKYTANNDMYEDSAYLQAIDHYISNTYRKREGYASGSATAKAAEWLDVGAAADASLSRLVSNLPYRNDVSRSNIAAVLNLRAHRGPFTATGHLLATWVADRVADIDTMPTYRKLTPYAGLRWALSDNLSLRYFYKETYRVPNFSELYFFNSIPLRGPGSTTSAWRGCRSTCRPRQTHTSTASRTKSSPSQAPTCSTGAWRTWGWCTPSGSTPRPTSPCIPSRCTSTTVSPTPWTLATPTTARPTATRYATRRATAAAPRRAGRAGGSTSERQRSSWGTATPTSRPTSKATCRPTATSGSAPTAR